MASSEEWSDYDTLVRGWRSEILHDVDSVPVSGVPGTCSVYSRSSVAILSGTQPQNICMAAASFMNGRVFAISHNGYFKNQELQKQPSIKQLLKNIFEWVSQGAYETEEDIQEITNKNTNYNGKKILMWSGGFVGPEQCAKVAAFVEKGGGLVHAMCPWGWLQLNHGKTLEHMPLMDILTSAGVSYTEAYCATKGHFKVDLSEAACHNEATQNIKYALLKVKSSEDLIKYGEQLSQGLASAPQTIKTQLYADMKRVYEHHKKLIRAPSHQKPMKDSTERCLTLLCDQLCRIGHEDMRCIPGVEEFLGVCGEGPALSVQREYTALLKNFHSTGLYAKPGQEITVDVLSSNSTLKDGWVLRIGSHTDNNTKLKKWERWPKLIKKHNLDESQIKIFSPYGGLIYLESPGFKIPHSISIKVCGAIEAPRFDLTDPACQKMWMACRDAPGPWADLSGHRITFTLPSSSIRHLDDPGLALAIWDSVVEAHCTLRGTDANDFRHQWVVCDAQPIAGYMHAGYPIVTMMDVANPHAEIFLLNPEHLLSEGCWGMYHELGHNFQRSWWTFNGTGEVTCNIFTLHAMDVVSNQKPWIHKWLSKQIPKMQKAVKKDNPYAEWVKDPGVGLGIYAQLQHAFGWEAYKKVFAHYEALGQKDRPNGDTNQIAYWIEQFSKTVGFNLSPLFEFWGFNPSPALQSRLNLPPFLPDDEMTQMAPDRVRVLEAAYPELVRIS